MHYVSSSNEKMENVGGPFQTGWQAACLGRDGVVVSQLVISNHPPRKKESNFRLDLSAAIQLLSSPITSCRIAANVDGGLGGRNGIQTLPEPSKPFLSRFSSWVSVCGHSQNDQGVCLFPLSNWQCNSKIPTSRLFQA